MLSPAGEAEASWNGTAVSLDQVREYTSLTTQVAPIATLVLVVTYGTDCARVSEYRRVIHETLDCEKTGVCVEVSP